MGRERYRARVIVDLAPSLFDAEVGDLVDTARRADDAGLGAVWVTDHFTGAVVDRRWSRDPFVVLGAMALATRRIDLGLLVANVFNRHPVQLAVAVDSVASLAPGRVRLGVGSGAAPGSRFAVEHESIGRPPLDAAARRRRLVDSIGALRAIWRGEPDVELGEVGFAGLAPVVSRPLERVIVGASAGPTLEVALEEADGVNLRWNERTPELLDRIGRRRPAEFEVSVLAWAGEVANGRVRVDRLVAAGVDRLVVGTGSRPADHEIRTLANISL